MSLVHRCIRGGALVSARTYVPDEAWEAWTHGWPPIGCARLKCSRCGEFVRQAPGFRLASPPPKATVVFSAERLTDAPGVHASEGGRLYACACTVHTAHATQVIDDLREARRRGEMSPVSAPWGCGGHPVPDADESVPKLAERGLSAPPPSPSGVGDERADWWVSRQLLRYPSQLSEVVQAARARLDTVDGAATRRALDFLRHHPAELPVDRPTERWLALSVPDPLSPFDLAHWYVRALIERLRTCPDAAARSAGLALVEAGVADPRLERALS